MSPMIPTHRLLGVVTRREVDHVLLRGQDQCASQGGQAQCEGSVEGAHHDCSDPAVRRLLQLHQALHTRRLVCKISQACQISLTVLARSSPRRPSLFPCGDACRQNNCALLQLYHNNSAQPRLQRLHGRSSVAGGSGVVGTARPGPHPHGPLHRRAAV